MKKLFDVECPFIGITGLIGSGKTTFGLAINPDDKTTKVIDFEKSASSYASERQFDYCDAFLEMSKAYPSGYESWQMWPWFSQYVKKIPSGKYRLLLLENITPLEDSLEIRIIKSPQDFGLRANQIEKIGSLKWAALKSAWQRMLMTLSTKFECVAWTVHLRNAVDASGTPIKGKKEPKGKETLMQLANLVVWLDRPMIRGLPQEIPNAKVLKTRLAKFASVKDKYGELIQKPVNVLPPNMKECTPNTIRWYMKNPFGAQKEVKEDQRIVDQELTEDEKYEREVTLKSMEIKAAELNIEASKRVTAKKQRSILDLRKEALDYGAITLHQYVEKLTELGVKKSDQLDESGKTAIINWMNHMISCHQLETEK